ncbi:MAG: hypothetical protein QG597_3863 [Actinomycetota bacterium]|nr:hypothetical protein [Actinomycetota bacterium]
MSETAPPGWPRVVPPPAAPQFVDRAVLWLLDNAPPEFRGHEVFRKYPTTLAYTVAHYVEGALNASREAYAGARRTLGPDVGVEPVEEVLRALEFEGVRLRTLAREVDLVAEALAGRRWVARL